MRQWRDTGRTNHLLINPVMDYPKEDLYTYYAYYAAAYQERFGTGLDIKYYHEFKDFVMPEVDAPPPLVYSPFFGWHDKRYLRVCMANLYEKYAFGKGVSPSDMARLYHGYKKLTGEDYYI